MSVCSTKTTCLAKRMMSRFWPIPVLKYRLMQRAHRSQNSRFPDFQFLVEHVRCHHRPVAGAVQDGTWMQVSSPVWPVLGCISREHTAALGVHAPPRVTPSSTLRPQLRQSQSARGDNSLCDFRNAEVTEPILVILDRVGSVLAQSRGHGKKTARRAVRNLQLTDIIRDRICDC